MRIPVQITIFLLVVTSGACGTSPEPTPDAQPFSAGIEDRATLLVDIATDATDPRNLSDTEPSIAVNPVDPQEIVVVTFSEPWGPDNAAPIWKSRNGGKTWQKVPQIPQPREDLGGPGDQMVAFDKDGRLHLVQLGYNRPQRLAKNFIYRQAGGADAVLTFGDPFGDDQPQIGVDTRSEGQCANRIYSAWLKYVGVLRHQAMASRSIDRGDTIEDRETGGNSSFHHRTARLAIGAAGEAYVIYKTREGQSGRFEKAHFRVHRSDDCGETWNALGEAGVSVHGPTPVMTWQTTEFGNPRKGKVSRARSSDASIAVDPIDGDVYATYINRDTSGFAQIYMARSTDRGKTWSSQRVTDGANHSGFPASAVADNGTVGILYIDYDDSGDVTIFRHRFARSFDHGRLWTDQVLQSMDPGRLENAVDGFLWGDYEGLTSHGLTFYGVFTGESIGRTTPQLDPIFFTISATQ